jgi:hypothetical protein
MGLAQPGAVMLECIKRAGRDDSRLTEPAADLLFEPPRSRDEVPRTDQAGADRSTQSLREAHAD